MQLINVASGLGNRHSPRRIINTPDQHFVLTKHKKMCIMHNWIICTNWRRSHKLSMKEKPADYQKILLVVETSEDFVHMRTSDLV
jgi:hypothetical protein